MLHTQMVLVGKTGLVSGNNHDYEVGFVFAAVQTLSKYENLNKFPRDYFDAWFEEWRRLLVLAMENGAI